MNVLYDKYRPKRFAEVVGQDAVVGALRGIIQRKSAKTFLFYGPSGTGKTTLARITARALGCHDKDIDEIPAAVHSKVEDMRSVLGTIHYKPFGDSQMRAIILDEVHMLSNSAWNSLLKILEEPPPHICWMLCTTEDHKVPKTIKTRSTTLSLKPVGTDDLTALLRWVVDEEKIKIPASVAQMIINEANGSPRQLLVNLETCRDAKDRKQAADLLRTVIETDTTRELCQLLVKGGSWRRAAELVNQLDGESPEGVRIRVNLYVGAILENTTDTRLAVKLLDILDSFSHEYRTNERKAPLLLSIGRVLLGS